MVFLRVSSLLSLLPLNKLHQELLLLAAEDDTMPLMFIRAFISLSFVDKIASFASFQTAMSGIPQHTYYIVAFFCRPTT